MVLLLTLNISEPHNLLRFGML